PFMTSVKYIGMDVHTESASICVRNAVGKIVMECVIETKASTILQFLDGLRGDLRVTFEEGTWATWLYDLLNDEGIGTQLSNYHQGPHPSYEPTQGALSQLGHSVCRHRGVRTALPCGMACQDRRSRCPATRRTLLPAT